MTHTKRAPTVFRTAGAAGLAAVTLVSGLSVGAAASAAPDDGPSVAEDRGTFVQRTADGWIAYDGTEQEHIDPERPSLRLNRLTGHSYSTREAAVAASAANDWSRWTFPAVGVAGQIKFGSECLTATSTYWVGTSQGVYPIGNVTVEPCRPSANLGTGSQVLTDWIVQSDGAIKSEHDTFNRGIPIPGLEFGLYIVPVAGQGWWAGAPGDTLIPEDPTSELTASVSKVNSIARSAVVSGTATPKATVTIGGKTVTVGDDGKWTATVDGLKVGANELTAVQNFNNAKVDEKTVTATVVDGGTLVGVDQGPVALNRGGSTQVPFLVQNDETRSNMVGTVTLTAPAGTTFDGAQSTVAAGYRSGTSGDFKPYSKLDLKSGRLSDNSTKLTFDVNTDGGNMVAGEQYQYLLNVTANQDAPGGSGAMAFTYAGDSSKGDYRATGRTSTTLEAAEAAEIIATTPTGRAGETSTSGSAKVQAEQVVGPMMLTAPTGTTFADVKALHVRDDAEQGNYQVTYNADRTAVTIDGPVNGSGAFWGSNNQYVSYTLHIPKGTAPGTISDGTAKVTANGATLAEGTFGVTVEAAAAAPLVITSPADGSTVETDSKRVVFSGTGAPGAHVQVRTQTASPRTIVDTYVGADGEWSQLGGDLNFDVNYVLDTIYTPQGGTAVDGTHRVTLKDTSGVVQDFAFTTPVNNSTVIAPNKQVRLAGTGTTGTTVTVWNYRSKDRVIGTATVGKDGTWVIPNAVLNNQNTRYELHVEYTAPGASTQSLTHNLLVKAQAGVELPFDFATPAEDSTVITPTGKVDFSGAGTTGSEVTIWNDKSKDRVVARAIVGEDGTWSTSGMLNNANGEYFLHVGYTEPGKTMAESTRHIFIKAEASTDRPFMMGSPAEGSTVTLSNFRPSDRNGEAVVSGEGTTGGVVKVWNYYTKDRIITKGGELTVDEDGKWSGTAEFRDQEYKIFVEYYAPGADTDGAPTQSFTRTFTAVAPTGK